MAQVYAQQARAQGITPDGTAVPVTGPQDPEAGSPGGGAAAHAADPSLVGQMAKLKVTNEKEQNGDDTDVSDEEPGEDLPLASVHGQMGFFCHSNPAISPASMWTRQDCVDFKNEIKKAGEGIIKVGHGETVTVRVPTHEEGNSLFWEFATDYYDIGFGVLFEWTVSDTNEVSITVSESSDEEELDEEGMMNAEGGEGAGDVESGPRGRRRDPNKPHIDEIMPVYRRDSHESVYAGSHKYPGVGVYLLKFDNSYSLWRSKTLYYRVFYTK
ncbi:hypothetical protein QR680_005651 [Steinernema hermaphroditum]|uniref:GOLD domain-containing protein n=1 Tax=Steinernema hermaphroditum TaxID=289476 RepID=A0AA39HU95_9BILA|nr:hypothetical protein QR680_005651 [Steinernema hermaphroditum]